MDKCFLMTIVIRRSRSGAISHERPDQRHFVDGYPPGAGRTGDGVRAQVSLHGFHRICGRGGCGAAGTGRRAIRCRFSRRPMQSTSWSPPAVSSADSKVDLVRSPVAVAVRTGAPRPDIGSEDALRRAVVAAASVGYSTGPSGAALTRLFERWGIAAECKTAPSRRRPACRSAQLVARGEVELGFQQLSAS